MKNIAVILFLAFSFNAIGFEGVVSVKYVSSQANDMPMLMNWFIDGDKVLLEIVTEVEGEEESLFLLPNRAEEKLYMYNENPAENGKNFYTEVSLDAITGDQVEFLGRLTGRNKEIESRNCSEVLATAEGMEIQMWVDESIGFPLFQFGDYFKTNYEIPALASIEMVGFPLMSRTQDTYGENLSLFEVQFIEETPVDDSKFSIPAGYVESSQVFEDDKE